MAKAGKEIVGRMRVRVMKGLTTTFASHYKTTVPLEGMLENGAVRECAAHGRKIFCNTDLDILNCRKYSLGIPLNNSIPVISKIKQIICFYPQGSKNNHFNCHIQNNMAKWN